MKICFYTTTKNINEIIDKSFLIKKPFKKEKGFFNNHKTVKPIKIIKHILKLTIFEKDNVVLDPFMGSGTTAIACKEMGINYPRQKRHINFVCSMD